MIDHDDECQQEQPPNARQPIDQRFWIPALILMSVASGAIAFVSLLNEEFRWGLVLGFPVSFGMVFGYGVRSLVPLWTIVACLTILACLITAAMAGDAIGAICGLVAAIAIAGPLVVGVLLGWSLKLGMRALGSERNVHVIVPFLFLPWALDTVESMVDLTILPEVFVASRALPVQPSEIWNTSLDTNSMRASPFEEFGLPRLKYATGSSTSVGDRKRFVYDKGNLEVEVTESIPNQRIVFRVLQQTGLEKRGALLLDGTMCLTRTTTGTTVELRVRYQPLMTPRWLCSLPEHFVATAAADRVLDWLESRIDEGHDR